MSEFLRPSYVPNTDADRAEMLRVVGVGSVDELFAEIPESVRNPELRLPEPLAEAELLRHMRELAAQNLSLEDYACFLGGGVYRHFVPSVVQHVIARNEFYTAYTPYQPEVSQGTLQALFEYQSLICDLTGMEVANASMYDGGSATAEAALMACRLTGRTAIGIADTTNPQYIEVLRTYFEGQSLRVEVFDADDPPTDPSLACLILQHPNFFGYLERPELAASRAREAGALLVMIVDPISLGLLKPPGEYGADIVVAEGQSLGLPLYFGGTCLGIFACRREHVRQMPGRLVGQTVDIEGRRGFVLTLQTREQHIRRERATSNICTSQSLLAIAAAAYLAALGKHGLRAVAEQCYHKAHYAAKLISAIPGYSLAFDRPFFKEFVVVCPAPVAEINRFLLGRKIIGGLDVSPYVPNGMLIAVTELNTRAEIERLAEALKDAAAAAAATGLAREVSDVR